MQHLPATGEPKNHTLDGGAVVTYSVHLPAARYLEVTVDQQGADVLIDVYDPAGRKTLQVDSPNGTYGPERVVFLSETAGDHLFELRSLNPPGRSGAITVRRLADRPASSRDRALAMLESDFADAEGMFRRGNAADLNAARDRYGSLLAQWRGLGLAGRETDTRMRRGDSERALGRFTDALVDYRAALGLAESLGDNQRQVNLWLRIGLAHFNLGEVGLAEESFRSSLAGAREISSSSAEAAALHNLGLAANSQGRFGQAVDFYRQALRIFEQLQMTTEEANAWSNLGEVYSRLGETTPARLAFECALERLRWLGNRHGEAIALNNLGLLHARANRLASAEQLLSKARQLLQETGDPVSEVRTLSNLGWIAGLRGALDEAATHYQQAMEGVHRLDDPRAEATLLLNLGWLAGARGDSQQALQLHRDALGRFEALGDPVLQAQALFGAATAERRAGNVDGAQAQCEAAIERVEQVRQRMAGDALGMAFFATRQDLYDFYVDLLIDRHQQDSDTGFSRVAFEASERSRARGLLDLLTTTDQHRPAASPIGLEAIRREVLDEDTALLHYHLGEKRSFVWVVTRASFGVRILPGSEDLEALATSAWQLLERSHQRRYREAAQNQLRQLASMVLWPAIEGLEARRLLVAVDGGLARLPFGALPIRRQPDDDQPLLAIHEVVHLHSASTLSALRLGRTGRPAATARLAVLADPVYESTDPRLPTPPEMAAVVGSSKFPRLEAAGLEAAAISSWVPADQRLVATGSDATRELVLSGRLAPFRLLHFAVHNVPDSDAPGRSALVLSRWSPDGLPIDGFLRMQDLIGLRLAAETVVLSGCNTALGRSLDGEGIVGLPHAFLVAGARQVVVSLIRVRDRATAELMRRFYRLHLAEGLPASASLREAQLSMAGDPQWQAPADWAGFVVIGDFSLSL